MVESKKEEEVKQINKNNEEEKKEVKPLISQTKKLKENVLEKLPKSPSRSQELKEVIQPVKNAESGKKEKEEVKRNLERYPYDNREMIKQICPIEFRNPLTSDIYKGFLKKGRSNPKYSKRKPKAPSEYYEKQTYNKNNGNKVNNDRQIPGVKGRSYMLSNDPRGIKNQKVSNYF